MLARSTIRLWYAGVLVLVVLGWLTACQHNGSGGRPQAEVSRDGWRVLEQVGEVQMRPPTAVHWLPLAATRSLVAGTRVSTGAQASLILAHGENQLIAGPGSAFELPSTAATPLQQHGGTVRYRAAAPPLISVQAGGLTLTAAHAVFTLAARTEATAVEVEAGEVRVNTQDSTARRLEAGQRLVLPASMAPPPVLVDANTPPVTEHAEDDWLEPVMSSIAPAPASEVALDGAGQDHEAAPFARLVQGLLAGVAEANARPGALLAPDAL